MVGIDLLITVISNIFTPLTFLFIILTVIYGILFGVIPGLGPALAITLLIPFSISMDPVPGLAILGAAYVSSVYGGSISAILINTPGEPTSVATTFDGYPMTRQGLAHIALGASLFASVVGGIISIIALVTIAPILADVAVKFGAAEFFAIGVFGLVIIAVVSRGMLLKGGIATVFGLGLALVGYSPSSGVPRYTFDLSYLGGGVPLVPVIVGLFAVSEAVLLIDQGGQIAEEDDDGSGISGSLMEGIRAAIRRPIHVLRASAIGVGFGIIPGIGAAMANFVAYFDLKSSSKNGDQFGSGVVEGVIGPEASNNAVTAAALIPTLVLGIPGNVATTLLLGALLFNEIQIGPLLFQESTELAYSFFFALFVANVLILVIGYVVSTRMISLTKIDVELIAPAIVIMSIIGTFALNFNVNDAFLTILVGLVTVFLRKMGYPPVNIVFGFILGPILERNFHRALQLSGGELSVFFDPLPLAMLSLSVILVAYNLLKSITGFRLIERFDTG